MLEEDPGRSLRREFAPSLAATSSSRIGTEGGRSVTVFELESGGPDRVEDGYSTVGGGKHVEAGALFQAAPWYERVYRRRCCLCTSFVLLFFFIWYATASNNSCRAKMAAPHASNRPFGTDTVLMHVSDDTKSTPVSNALMGKKTQQELRFIVVGNFGRDGFCFQNDVATEMEKVARSLKTSFIVNTGNAFFPGGLVSLKNNFRNSRDTNHRIR